MRAATLDFQQLTIQHTSREADMCAHWIKSSIKSDNVISRNFINSSSFCGLLYLDSIGLNMFDCLNSCNHGITPPHVRIISNI